MFAPGFNSPTRFEADVYDCEVWGKIPSDIEGTFYRVQCDFQYRPPMNEWPTGFNGDGHVSAFRFANGSVDFKARYVKTARLRPLVETEVIAVCHQPKTHVSRVEIVDTTHIVDNNRNRYN